MAKRRRARRRLIIGLLASVAVVLAAQRAAAPAVQRALVRKIEASTGLTPRLSGLSLSLLRGSATLHDFALPNPAPFLEPYLLEARRVTVDLSLLKLLRKRLVVETVSFRGATLSLERNRQGLWNLQALAHRLSAKAARGPGKAPPIEKLLLERSQIRILTRGPTTRQFLLKDVKAYILNLDRSLPHPLASPFGLEATLATPLPGKLRAQGRTNLFLHTANFDLAFWVRNLDLSVLRLIATREGFPVRGGLASLSGRASCRRNFLQAKLRTSLYRIELEPHGSGQGSLGPALPKLAGLLSQTGPLVVDVELEGPIRHPRVQIKPALEALVAKALKDTVMIAPEAALEAGKKGLGVTEKALEVGKSLVGGAKTVGKKLIGLFRP